jgi:hypothetical protein
MARIKAEVAEAEEEIPLYKLTERAYLNDVLHEVDAEVEFEGMPGHYMIPLNDAAVAMVEAYPPTNMDPINSIPINEPVRASGKVVSQA